MERIKGANGELMKYSMQPMDGEGRLTLYRYGQPAVGGADNAHVEFWQEIEELRKQRADAQATIAALQARVQELEAIKTPDDAFTYCAYCGEKSPVDEHNEDLAAHIKICPKHPMRDVESQLTQRTAELHETQNHLADADNEVEQLRKQLSERTAELEAVSNFIGVQYDAESRTWVSGQAPYQSAGTTKQEACIAAVDALRLACATWETKYRDLQAELERMRALIKALPKVEGEITVKQRGDEFVVMVGTLIWLKCYKTDEILINAIVALWQHRQGMEG